jgi:hypothetical protein
MKNAKGYYFTADELCALATLLALVHYDDLASDWYNMLPETLRKDIDNQEWNNWPLNRTDL